MHTFKIDQAETTFCILLSVFHCGAQVASIHILYGRFCIQTGSTSDLYSGGCAETPLLEYPKELQVQAKVLKAHGSDTKQLSHRLQTIMIVIQLPVELLVVII